MKCPECGAKARVTQTRAFKRVTKRYRKCEAGHNFISYESIIRPIFHPPSERKRKWRKENPEKVLETSRRSDLRRQARAEAESTGTPVDEIYALWGVVSLKEKRHDRISQERPEQTPSSSS